MSIDTDPAGGYLAPPQFASRIAEVGAEMGVMRQLAQVHTTDTGDYHIPVARTLAAAAWTSERGDRSETATPDLGQVHPAHGALYAVAPVTNWLLQDAAYDVAGFVARSIGEQFGVAESEAFAKGNGINRPMGILSYPFAEQGDATRPWGTIEEVRSGRDGEVAGTAGAEAYPLITLLYKLAPRYRRNASWLAHPNAVEKMRKLKDTQGQYLWQPPLTVGQPATFLGLPVHEDANLEAPATGSRSVLVGGFQRAYVITDIGRMTFVRDTVTKKGYTLFYFERRVGGALLDSNAVKALRGALVAQVD